MLGKIRARLSYANVMATIAVFVALGGSGYAAVAINGKDLKNRSVAGTKLKRNTLRGTEINESRLAKVPAAVNADRAGTAGTANRANSATSANSAASAANADQLDGKDSPSFQPRIQHAFIESNGNVASQTGGITASREGVGTYFVTFPSSVTGKAVAVTPSRRSQFLPITAEIAATQCGLGFSCFPPQTESTILVNVSNSTGAVIDQSFYIVVGD